MLSILSKSDIHRNRKGLANYQIGQGITVANLSTDTKKELQYCEVYASGHNVFVSILEGNCLGLKEAEDVSDN